VLCRAVLCCAVLCCAVLCCAVLCCAVAWAHCAACVLLHAFCARHMDCTALLCRCCAAGAFIVTGASLFAILSRHSITPALAGLSISYALQVTQTLNWMVRQSAEVESKIVSVERLKEYSLLNTEPHDDDDDARRTRLPASWPDKVLHVSCLGPALVCVRSRRGVGCACAGSHRAAGPEAQVPLRDAVCAARHQVRRRSVP
jgi:hypothetical protein